MSLSLNLSFIDPPIAPLYLGPNMITLLTWSLFCASRNSQNRSIIVGGELTLNLMGIAGFLDRLWLKRRWLGGEGCGYRRV